MKNYEKKLKKYVTYEDLMIATFSVLIDIYGIDTAIVLLYEINKFRGKKI